MLRTRFTELVGCAIPLQQAGMGGVTTPRLVAAVTEAGGFGMVAGIGVPAPRLAGLLGRVREQTSGPFGVNFVVPFLDRACVDGSAQAPPSPLRHCLPVGLLGADRAEHLRRDPGVRRLRRTSMARWTAETPGASA